MEIRVVLALVLSTQFAVTEFRKVAASSDSSDEEETQTRGEERKAPDKHPAHPSSSGTDYPHVRSPSGSLTESVRPFSSCSSGVYSQTAPDSSSPRSSTSSSTTKTSFYTASWCSRPTSTVYGSFSDSEEESSKPLVTPPPGHSPWSLHDSSFVSSSTKSMQPRSTVIKSGSPTSSALSSPACSAYKLTQHSSKGSVELECRQDSCSDTGLPASSSLEHTAPGRVLPASPDAVMSPTGRVSPTEFPSARTNQEISLGSEGAFIPRCSPTISYKRGTSSGVTLPRRMTLRYLEHQCAPCPVSDSKAEPSGRGEGTSARKPADIARAGGHPIATGQGERSETSRPSSDPAPLEISKKTRSLAALFRKGAFRVESLQKVDASADGDQERRTRRPLRSASFQFPRMLKSSTFPLLSGAPTPFASNASSVASPTAKPTSSSTRRSQSMLASTKHFTAEERRFTRRRSKLFDFLSKRTASTVHLLRPKTSAVNDGAIDASSSDGANKAETADQRGMQERAAHDRSLWERMRRYENDCADSAVQSSLHALTDQVFLLVNIMKTDAHRAGPFFQSPEICQSERPQMICPHVLHYIGTSELVDLAKKKSPGLPLGVPGEQEKYVLESLVPTGKETVFTSLVRGKTVILKKEALFVVAAPMHLMVMRDRRGQLWFLEAVIVDCNKLNEELLIGNETSRLADIRNVREMTSLKISAIADAFALSSVDDILMLTLDETATEQEVGNNLYAVARFFKVKQPWLTDLGTMASLLRKEALDPQNQEAVFRMRLNLTVQILAVVGSMDSVNVLPRHFNMRGFGLRPNGTILGLFSPASQSLRKRSVLLTNPAKPHQSRFSLVGMLAALWCPEGLDLEILAGASDWQKEPYHYFPNCVPRTPLEVKNLMVQLCSPQTTELYSMLHGRNFNRLVDMLRSAVQGSKRETKGDRRTERALRRRQARVKEAPT